MTVSSVAPDDPVQASTINQLIANINSAGTIIVYAANGTFTVPAGVHRFRIHVVGGGGHIGDDGVVVSGDDVRTVPGTPGGASPMITAVVAGQDIGSTFAVVVGAGGTSASGGTSSFGSLLSSGGGGKGNVGGSAYPGSFGAIGGSLASMALQQGCPYICEVLASGPRVFGEGGAGGTTANGAPGVVIVEW